MPNIEIPSNPSELWIIAVVIILILTGVFTLLTLQQKNQTTQEIEKTEMMKSLLFDLQKRANDCIESEKESKEGAKEAGAKKAAEGKEGKFKAVMEAYKAGKDLKKEGNKLHNEIKGKQNQKKGKSSSSASEKDDDEEKETPPASEPAASP